MANTPVIFYDFRDYVQTLCGYRHRNIIIFKTLLEKVIPYKTHTKRILHGIKRSYYS